MMEIRAPQNNLEWENYFDLRFRILRKPLQQPIGSEKNEGDATGIHFALYENQVLKAIARLDLQDENMAQVRFVAVENNSQGKGFGKKLMLEIENYCKQNQLIKIELQARENAVPFYLSLDYELIKPTHLLFGKIQHFLMVKEIERTK